MARLLVLLLLTFSAHAGWRVVREGVEYQRIVRGPLDVHVVRVNLRDANLRVIATDRQDRGRSVADFAKRNDAIVAINGDYFTQTMETIGLAMGACGVWAKPKKTRAEPWIAVGKGRVEIEAFTKPRRWMTGAVAGWPLLVDACQVRTPLPGSAAFTRTPHPRTAAGLTNDDALLLVTTRGRGVTLPELAQLLRDLGACTAINLDGGSSTAMWLDGALLPGSATGRVANHLGVIESTGYSGCQQKEGKINP
ncbi:MAG TPA: phosphodiester glycosidase family protein [Thermoanaerobaculia bacterium]|nr:phosphodiester glycosidase family protein [Thermoanaerobaculia bacterium]